MLIKICGITNLTDALAAVNAGADMLGFIFAGSPRQISPTQAREIISKLPKNIIKVGVFVNDTTDYINKSIKNSGINLAQLHGHEMPKQCLEISVPVIKAFRVSRVNDFEDMQRYNDACKMILLDTFVKGKQGGTGKTFDWSLVEEARQYTKLPIILSGGLTPDNVAEAISIAKPYGVDVSSGVERLPGIKDHKKIAEFIANARTAAAKLVGGDKLHL